MNAYKVVVLRVQDTEKRPIPGRALSMVRFTRAGVCLDFQADEKGEVELLLPPGTYGIGTFGVPHVQFEVTRDPGRQIVEITVPGSPH